MRQESKTDQQVVTHQLANPLEWQTITEGEAFRLNENGRAWLRTFMQGNATNKSVKHNPWTSRRTPACLIDCPECLRKHAYDPLTTVKLER